MSKPIFRPDTFKTQASLFTDQGGEFTLALDEFYKKAQKIKAFIFDWDGVFNNGAKSVELSSGFAEPDAMGLNMLRYNYWIKHRELPIVTIITGVDNKSAYHFAEREHLHCVYSGFKDKSEPVTKLMDQFGVKKVEIASMFDDIIDYPLAQLTELRCLVRRESSMLTTRHFRQESLFDYKTFSRYPENPVREFCELMIASTGDFDYTLSSRFSHKEDYLNFWTMRQSQKTLIVKNEGSL